jgi:hypothetical protein
VAANLLAQVPLRDALRPADDGPDWVMWLFVAVFLAIVWWATRRRYSFSIVAGGEGVRFKGVAELRQQRLKEFLVQECGIVGPLRIDGGKSRGGRLLLRFRGEIDSGTRQRIRNFLLTQL